MLCCIPSLEKRTTDTRSWQVVACCYSNHVLAEIVVFSPWGCDHIPLPAERAPFQSPLLYFKHFCMEIGQYFPFENHGSPPASSLIRRRGHESLQSISKSQLVHHQMEIWVIWRTKQERLMWFDHLLLISQIYNVTLSLRLLSKLNASHVIRV